MQRTALVTGAGGTIGRAIVERLRRDDFHVLTTDIVGDVDIHLDIVRDPLPDAIFGTIDVCVSNAGVVDTMAPAHTMSADKWSRDIDVNLTGAFRVVQACLPGMRARRYGRIIAVSSVAGSTGLGGKVSYAASKAGLQGAMKTIAIENSHRGITVNCVQPGFVDAPGVDRLPPAAREALLGAIPAGRFADPRDVANLIAFLAADSGSYITGQEIAVDGGVGLHRLDLIPETSSGTVRHQN